MRGDMLIVVAFMLLAVLSAALDADPAITMGALVLAVLIKRTRR